MEKFIENTEEAIKIGKTASLDTLIFVEGKKREFKNLARKYFEGDHPVNFERRLNLAMEAATQAQFCRECLEVGCWVSEI